MRTLPPHTRIASHAHRELQFAQYLHLEEPDLVETAGEEVDDVAVAHRLIRQRLKELTRRLLSPDRRIVCWVKHAQQTIVWGTNAVTWSNQASNIRIFEQSNRPVNRPTN